MKLTRRTVLALALPALAVAQTPTTLPTSAPDYLAISAAQYKRNADALASVRIPIETEPAFHFKP